MKNARLSIFTTFSKTNMKRKNIFKQIFFRSPWSNCLFSFNFMVIEMQRFSAISYWEIFTIRFSPYIKVRGSPPLHGLLFIYLLYSCCYRVHFSGFDFCGKHHVLNLYSILSKALTRSILWQTPHVVLYFMLSKALTRSMLWQTARIPFLC